MEVLTVQDDALVMSRDGDERVWIIAPTSASADAAERLERFYALRRDLDPAWALVPVALRHRDGLPVLVAADPGGQPLTTLLSQPIELAVFLRVAIGIASALTKLHSRGLIHRDIKPASILVERASGRAWLTGLGRALRAQRQRQALTPPHMIAGTLAYMAPEQTGRMNRSIDSRSDLYAFGVVLYQLVSGELPFTAHDPMELVHCHVARHPVPPHERSARIPRAVSAIVMKLLAKAAEDRYQTAAGVQADLELCLNELLARDRIPDFSPGARDSCDRFLIPEKLYGRQREIAQLLAAFDAVVASGRPGLMLVSGYSGVGKSSVVNELHKALIPPRGLFASGKFDQLQRDIPYATLAQALQKLIGMLLLETDAELARYRDSIRAATEPYGQLVVNLVPELESVIGKQLPIPELAPGDAQRVFEQVLRRFIGVFARPEHPLALFLDDLQWIDSATLHLIQQLLVQEEVRSLFLVGAYRDNEIGAEHPLAPCLEAILNAGVPVARIQLEPLALSDVTALLAETLHDDHVQPLAQLVHDKTAGNPFFTIQFLIGLADDGLIRFDPSTRQWAWDLSGIATRGFTDNIVALMIQRITRLPAACREALQIIACIGNTARVEVLAAALDLDEPALHAAFAPALSAGLLAQQGGTVAFLHDRIQEASYALIPEGGRPLAHLGVGRRLVARMAADDVNENVYEVVTQLNRGVDLVSDREELDGIAELNLKAGKRAKAAAAYATAIAFLRTGATTLGERRWERRRELSFALEIERAECEFSTGELDQAEARLAALVARSDGHAERAAVACLRITLYVTRGEPARSVEICAAYLERDGRFFNPHPSRADVEVELARVWRALGSRPIEDLAHLPESTDLATLATMDVLCAVASPAWFLDPLLPALVAARLVSLSLERGNGPHSSYGYAILAVKLGPITGDYALGYRLAKVSLELGERTASPRLMAGILFAYAVGVRPWSNTLDPCRELLARAVACAELGGAVTQATYNRFSLTSLVLFSGAPLEEAEAACRNAIDYARRINFDFIVHSSAGQASLTRALRDASVPFGSFEGAGIERAFEHTRAPVPELAFPMAWYWIYRQQALFLAGDIDGAVAAAEAAEPLLWCADVFLEFAEHHFYAALARGAMLDSADAPTRQKLREQFETSHRVLARFGENSPVTLGSRAALVAAERARLDADERRAMDLYERAIRSARVARFVQIEALSFELAARFYAARGFDVFAATYRREARAAYLRWGAHGKVRQLEQLFPDLREQPGPEGTTSINAPVESLDLATVIKVSQLVSSQMVLPKLLHILMRTAIEHAGATRAVLISKSGDELQVEAEAWVSSNDVMVRLGGRDDRAAAPSPEALVRYVMSAQRSVFLDDAFVANEFSSDGYVASRRARAMACLPLMYQAQVTGVLYLENGLAPQTFTPTRVAVLKLLASQAAISIENTRLYANLQEREARIRRLVDANVIGIFIWNLDGSIRDANDAFLRMLQQDRQQLSAGLLRWKSLIPQEWRASVDRCVTEIEVTGILQPFELEYTRRDGSCIPVLVGAAAFEPGGEDGVAFVLDLSAQKDVERQLRRSEAYLAEAQRLTHTGSWSYDIAREKLGHCSDGLARLFGFERATCEPSLKDFSHRVHVADRARTMRTTLRAVRTGRDFDTQFRAVIPGESAPRYIQCLGHPVFDGSGRLVEFVGTVMDVTERRRADLERERLRQAQSDLAHVTRVTTLGELTASLAHELTQPLTGALINAKTCLRALAHETPDLELVRTATGRAHRDVQRASDIVARIELLFRKRPLPRQPVDLRELIHETIAILRSEAARHSIVIRTELAPTLPLVVADAVQVQQVIMNLVVNAIEAMKGAGGLLEIVVSARALTEHVVVSVSDMGKGISAEDASRIFDAFFTTKVKGTGMGLSISRSIVESHGGRLSACNNPDRGATFQFALPVGAGPAARRFPTLV